MTPAPECWSPQESNPSHACRVHLQSCDSRQQRPWESLCNSPPLKLCGPLWYRLQVRVLEFPCPGAFQAVHNGDDKEMDETADSSHPLKAMLYFIM